ncbi:MAG: RNA polymerase sigma-70 factor [Bacteroidales bacterium]|nr:RNA polymerase sigma-70 factor [Bacteroidales bacterium]
MKKKIEIESLLYRISIRDSKAFTQFYDLYFDKIYQIAFYFIKSQELCEEVVSDIFMMIWESGTKLQKIDNIDSYLFISTRNRAFYYLSQKAGAHNISVDEIPFEALFHNDNPEEIAVNDEFRHEIDEAINQLPNRCKQIFLMAREEGLKYKEIARLLSISEKTVNAQMVTAIRKLALALRHYVSFFF